MITNINSTVIYISESGNDGYSGYIPIPDGLGGGPIRGIPRLLEMIHTMRSSGVMQPVSVRFMGDYHLNSPICIGPRIFSAGCGHLETIFSVNEEIKNITFESYGEKRARLIGGRHLSGFKDDTFNGVKCLSLHIPEVQNGSWNFTDLYVNGKASKRTRYPKTGALDAVTTELPNGAFFEGSKWFIAKKEDLEGVDGIENATVSFYHYWIDEHSPVESYDKESGKIVMVNRSRFNTTVSYNVNPKNPPLAASDLHFYLENIPQTFSDAGEWYLDVPKGMLYYIPEDGQDAGNIEVLAPTVEQIAKIYGTADNKTGGIRFRNIDFVCSKGDYTSKANGVGGSGDSEEGYAADAQSVWNAYGAVSFKYAEDCGLYNCNLTCLGIHGVEIAHGCEGVRVENCTFKNLGGGGVKIIGKAASDETLTEKSNTSHCIIRGNTIENCGRRHAAACGVLVLHSSHNEIAENEISYLDYTGVSVGWVWGYNKSATYGNIIRNNHIHHIGMGNLSDMGGIYTLGSQNGTVIEGNIIHDIRSEHYGGWGIYPDEGSSYILIENNIVYNTNCDCFHQHYGSHNTVRNNIFAFGGQAIVRLSRREEHTGAIFEDNVFITDGTPVYAFGTSGEHMYPGPCLRATRNKVWDVSGKPFMLAMGGDDNKKMSLEEWQNVYGLDEGSLVELPENIVIDGKTIKAK